MFVVLQGNRSVKLERVEGKIVGGFTLYEKGKAVRSQDWNGLSGKEHRCIENCKSGLAKY